MTFRKIAAILLLALCAPASYAAGVVTMSGPRLYVDAPSGTDPYAWYPALDLNTIPFHTGSGAWGAQRAINAPTAPAITTSADVATNGELATCIAVSGRRCTVTANLTSFDSYPTVTSITDVEIVVPNGILINGMTLSYGATTDRLKITKASGDTIGGQIHGLGFYGHTNDLIIDGIQASGATGTSGAMLFADASDFTRVAIVNNQIICANYCSGYGGIDWVIAGNSIVHDANLTDNSGDWGFRLGGHANESGPYVIFRNEVHGDRFPKFRFDPSSDTDPYYIYAAENITMDRNEGKFFSIVGASGSPWDRIAGAWILNNTHYVDGLVQMEMTRADATPGADYVRANGNTINGHTSGITAGGAADADTTGNTYNAALGTDPAFNTSGIGAGDPRAIDYTP